MAKDIAFPPEPMQPVLRKGRMVWNLVVEIEPRTTDRPMQLDFLGQLAF
jgi:hypothetical protein